MLKRIAAVSFAGCVFAVSGVNALTVIMDDSRAKIPPLAPADVNKNNGALGGNDSYGHFWDTNIFNPDGWAKASGTLYSGAYGQYAYENTTIFNNTGELVQPGQQYKLKADFGDILGTDTNIYVRATQNADGTGASFDLAHANHIGDDPINPETGATNAQFANLITVTNSGPVTPMSLAGYYIQVRVATGPNYVGGFYHFFQWLNVTADTPVFTGPQWALDSGGDWNNAGNWGNATVPNGIGSVALLGGAITSGRTVYADASITLGSLTFDNANSYNVSGLGTLTMEVGSGQGTISVLQGNHKINLPLVFQSDTTVTAAPGATLTIADPTVIKANKTVTKTGTVNLTAPLLIEAGGSLVVAGPAMGLFAAPSIAAGGEIDVTNSGLNIDYHGMASVASAIKGQLTTGYADGAWNGTGINTSSAVAGQLGIGWVDDSASQTVRVKFTRYGDADLDGTVTSTDFNALVAGYGNTTTGVWATGDFNYDGKVTTLDFNMLAGNFGQSAPAAALGSVVPEPASIAGIVLGTLACLRRRRAM